VGEVGITAEPEVVAPVEVDIDHGGCPRGFVLGEESGGGEKSAAGEHGGSLSLEEIVGEGKAEGKVFGSVEVDAVDGTGFDDEAGVEEITIEVAGDLVEGGGEASGAEGGVDEFGHGLGGVIAWGGRADYGDGRNGHTGFDGSAADFLNQGGDALGGGVGGIKGMIELEVIGAEHEKDAVERGSGLDALGKAEEAIAAGLVGILKDTTASIEAILGDADGEATGNQLGFENSGPSLEEGQAAACAWDDTPAERVAEDEKMLHGKAFSGSLAPKVARRWTIR
jgi:hypothetical protein